MGAAENRQIVADACAAFGQQDIGALINSLTDDVVWTNHPAAAPASGGADKSQFGQVN